LIITSEAAEKVKKDNRKTIKGEDLLEAMKNLGFEKYEDMLKIYLTRY
jgi:histone H3/H4